MDPRNPSLEPDLSGSLTPKEAEKQILDLIPQFIKGIPNSAWAPIFWGQLRGIIAMLAGMGFSWARWVEGSEGQQYITGVILLICLFSSGWNKVKAEITKYRLSAESADKSATATANATPADVPKVPVAVTPVGVKAL